MSGTVSASLPTTWPHFPKQASPLDPTLSTSMSFGDPTDTFSMSSDGHTSFCPLSTHADHRWHSFHVHCRTSLRWSLSTATPLTMSVASSTFCRTRYVFYKKMALVDHVWNFPFLRCRRISYIVHLMSKIWTFRVELQ
jgi:hypothetical protein